MQIKIFTAPRLHEALALVRQGLGPDAVILDRLQSEGADGQKMWHVHAAVDSEPVAPVASSSPTQAMISSNLEASMQRLEKIAASLGNRDVEQYRQAIGKQNVRDAFDHLLEMGVASINAFEMAEDYAKNAAISMKTLHWSERINPLENRVVMLLSGPSGAGKSLLAAKLATHYSLKGVSVALVTTDGNRMGGSEVLRSYAGVLGLPFSVVRNKKDAEEARESTKSAQLVLIDTEGWNNRHAASLHAQMELWDVMACTHRVLVMPASMDESDGVVMLKRAQSMAMTQIAFTKLDETLRPGKVVNWAEASRMPMSYCSFGPEVPDQLGWLSPKALTAILVKHYRQQEDEIEEETIA